MRGRAAGARLGDQASVYVALCGDSAHESGRCVSDEGVLALEEYYNQGRRPGRAGGSSSCRAVCATTQTGAAEMIISDAGLIDL